LIYTRLHIALRWKPPFHAAACAVDRREWMILMRIDMEIYAAVVDYAWYVLFLYSPTAN